MDWEAYLTRHDPRLLTTPEGRRELCRYDPLLFALLYFRDMLSSDDTRGQISFSQFHLDLAESAKQWARQGLGVRELREAWLAPRGSGKSTWIFEILPCWALAYRHRKYAMALGSSASRSEKHLANIKRRFATNQMLRKDFPDLVRPMRRPGGTTDSDNRSMYLAKSGVVFEAAGIDSSVLGALVDGNRPDLLIFDDIEPDEGNYSLYQKEQRLKTVRTSAFPLGLNAVVQFVGTVHMAGSIMDDLVCQVTEGPDTSPEWPRRENIRVRYYDAIQTLPDGTEASLWPQRWTMEDFDFEGWRYTSEFQVEMRNLAMSTDGAYWSTSDFRYGSPEAITKRLISIDPAISTKTTSDFTGIAVVAYSDLERKVVVEYASGVKLSPRDLKTLVLRLVEQYNCRMVYVETNQGGDWVTEMLSPMPPGVVVKQVKQSVKKEIRWSKSVDYWQRGWVYHAQPLPAFENQAVAVPKSANDDVVDAVTSGVSYYLEPLKRTPTSRRDRQYSYAGV